MKIQPTNLLLSGLGATVVALAAAPAGAQTVEQNDSSAQAARRANSLPLIPARTLDFTTDEGTWIDVDLSPDGETIVFELLGDLYTIPVAGGEATRITSGQGYDMQPRYSVDGSEIVFVSDRDGSENIWVANADGSDPRQLTDTERDNYMSPVWTPDGEYVMANKGTQLWYRFFVVGSTNPSTPARSARPKRPPITSACAQNGPSSQAASRPPWTGARSLPSGWRPVRAGTSAASSSEP